MTKTLHLIGCASGIAGADIHSGDGPLAIQKSPYLTAAVNAGLPIVWDQMIRPVASDKRVDQAVRDFSETLAKAVSTTLKAGHDCTVIGGDHSCAIGTWSGVYDVFHAQGDLGLIWIDAHMDSHTPETSESGRIHGMPLATLLGHGYPTLTSVLHDAPKFKPENVCLIGVRSYEEGEANLLKRLNVRVYFMEEVRERGFETVLHEAVKHVSKNTIGYGLTLDIDAIDPQEAPGVDVPEPNGIHVDAILSGLTQVATDPRLVATEIVEFDPSRDQKQLTEQLVVNLLEAIAKR